MVLLTEQEGVFTEKNKLSLFSGMRIWCYSLAKVTMFLLCHLLEVSVICSIKLLQVLMPVSSENLWTHRTHFLSSV